MKLGLLAAILLAASASSAGAAAKAEYAKVHTIGVLSLLGDRVDMQTHGFGRFGYEDYKLDLDMKLDGQLSAQVATALQPAFTVKAINADPAKLSGLDLADGSDLRRLLQGLPDKDGIDAFVVVHPYPVGADYDTRGLITQYEKAFIHDATTLIATYYMVSVYDAAGHRIDYGTGQYPSGRTITGHEFPWEVCAADIRAGTADQTTDEQKARLKKVFRAQTSRSIAFTLASAGLIDKAQATAVTAGFDTEGDPSCHPGP